MRIREILESATTSSGSIATVASPLMAQSRDGGNLLSGKYTNTPFTGQLKKQRKNRARRQFENSIGN
jgi:hypothetical protein